MRRSLSFWGIILSLIFDFSNEKSAAEGCRNTADCEDICVFCDKDFTNISLIMCYHVLLNGVCLRTFISEINVLSASDICEWDSIKRPYNQFTQCTETTADCLQIPWPNQMVEDIFVGIHATYFKACTFNEFNDPSPHVVFALVMTPVCLIPVMVALVVMKTKDRGEKA